MPELPEVETVRLQLKHKVIGATIKAVDVFHPKTVAHDMTIGKTLAGKTITDIDRIGKLLIFSFLNEPDLFLLAHLKRTGQFFFVDKKGHIVGGGHSLQENFGFSSRSSTEKRGRLTAPDTILPNKHTRVAFRFVDDATLFFNDMRLFGYTKLANQKDMNQARVGFGPEPIDPEFDTKWFIDRVRRRNTPIKAALLDQSFVSGLGNIYVDEALWRAHVRPTRRASSLTRKEAAAIAEAARAVLQESIAVGGTTFQHFVDTDANKGNFTNYLQVFGKQDTACARCGGMIKKIRCAGRGTHYCPSCQK
jgi:formamidopyrimidine-DNA glycosylase